MTSYTEVVGDKVGIVLAAGLGTRLRPSTDYYPKPLIPVAGVEPLFYALEQFERLGIHKVIVNTHYRHEDVLFRLKTWSTLLPRLEIRTSIELPHILGSGGGIIKIVQDNQDWFHNRGLLVQNGDTIGGIDLSCLYKDNRKSSFAVSKFPLHLKQYNPLWLSPAGSWDGIGKTPPHPNSVPAHFLGAYYFNKDLVNKLNSPEFKPEFSDLFNGIWRPMTNYDEVFYSKEFHFDDTSLEPFWFDMTTQEHLLKAQNHLMATLKRPLGETVWGRCLEKRYPGLNMVKEFCWSNCSDSADSLKWHQGPALFVSNSELPFQVKINKNSCYINENRDPVPFDQRRDLELTNAVVLVKPGDSVRNVEPSFPMSGRIENAICIL